jgi:hypothetical protein
LLSSLTVFVELATDGLATDRYTIAVVRAFPGVTSHKAARSYTKVVIDLGLIDRVDGRVVATPLGRRYLKSQSRAIVRKALSERIAGIDELVEELERKPDRIGLLLPRLQTRGFPWRTASQIRYRLRWLEEVGVVTKTGKARPIYSLARRPRP